jgi:hypothetical protein
LGIKLSQWHPSDTTFQIISVLIVFAGLVALAFYGRGLRCRRCAQAVEEGFFGRGQNSATMNLSAVASEFAVAKFGMLAGAVYIPQMNAACAVWWLTATDEPLTCARALTRSG